MNKELVSLVKAGNLLLAIRQYQKNFDVSMSEARTCVFALRQNYQNSQPCHHASDSPYDYQTIEQRVQQYKAAGDSNQANDLLNNFNLRF